MVITLDLVPIGEAAESGKSSISPVGGFVEAPSSSGRKKRLRPSQIGNAARSTWLHNGRVPQPHPFTVDKQNMKIMRLFLHGPPMKRYDDSITINYCRSPETNRAITTEIIFVLRFHEYPIPTFWPRLFS